MRICHVFLSWEVPTILSKSSFLDHLARLSNLHHPPALSMPWAGNHLSGVQDYQQRGEMADIYGYDPVVSI